MTIILVLLGFLVGAFIMTMGGGGGAFYLGIMTGVAHLSPSTALTQIGRASCRERV